MKHSPGPFQRGSLRSCDLELLDARGLHIATVHHPVGERGGADPADTQNANAALLLAAPDLLAACRLAVAATENDNDSANLPSAVLAALNEAIAHATGGVA